MNFQKYHQTIFNLIQKGLVIPAHPLALTFTRKVDVARQQALTRYYLAAGAGGIAVGVHTTQFEIRRPEFLLLRPILELTAETIREYEEKNPGVSIVRIAGVCGDTSQAEWEASLAQSLGYHAGLLSLGAWRDATTEECLAHARRIAEIIPIMGFYLQPSVGGRILDYRFWRQLCDIPNLVAIKIAPFNRYQTLDVVRAVAESGRANEIALYTGNDDHILLDLLSTYEFQIGGKPVQVRCVGGLLGQWAVWTRKAVEIFLEVRALVDSESPIPPRILTLANQITDANAALFDPAHDFTGCITGINEALRRQGLMEVRWCLNPQEELSPGQWEEIDRVYTAYPHLRDDEFIAEHLDEWLR